MAALSLSCNSLQNYPTGKHVNFFMGIDPVKTGAGTPCKRKDLYQNDRCRLHGGWNTGPTTPEGKAWSAQNGFKK